MTQTFNKPTQTYDDELATTIKVFQHIEKYKIPLVLRNGLGIDRYNQSRGGKIFTYFFLNTPPSTFYEKDTDIPNELKDLLDIEDLITSEGTELLVTRQTGQTFTREVYKIIPAIDGLQFNLTSSEIFDINQTDTETFNHPGFGLKEGIIFKTRIPFLSFFLERTRYRIINLSNFNAAFNDELVFGETHKLDDVLANSYYTGEMITLMTLASLKSLFLILKERPEFNVTVKLLDYIFYESPAGGVVSKDILTLRDIEVKTQLDLTKDTIDVFQLMTSSAVDSISISKNKINAADGSTYSKFISSQDNNLAVFNAFDILPIRPEINELNIRTSLIEIQAYIVKTTLFFMKNVDLEEAKNLYQIHQEKNINELKERWDKISKRLKKYHGDIFVPKLNLALLFINKYFLPTMTGSSYNFENYFYQNLFGDPSVSRKIPFSFNFFKFMLGHSVSSFFNIGSHEDYFLNFYKFSADVINYTSNKRFEINTPIPRNETLIKSLYFPRNNYNKRLKNYNQGEWERKKNIVILEDSFTKQGWKTKTKIFLDLQPFTKNNYVYIIKVNDKIELLKAKRILKDRPDVYQYSEFAKNIRVPKKERKNNSTVPIRFFSTEGSLNSITKNNNWSTTNTYDDLSKDNAIIVRYSPKSQEVEINNNNYLADNRLLRRLAFWNNIFMHNLNKRLVIINNVNLKRLEKNTDVSFIEEYLNEETLKPFKENILGTKIIMSESDPHKSQLSNVLSFIKIKVFGGSSPSGRYGNIQDRVKKEEMAYRILSMIPQDHQNLIADLMAIIITNSETRKDSHGEYLFFSEKKAIFELPPALSFDYQIMQTLFGDLPYNIDMEKITKLDIAIRKASRNIYSSDIVDGEDLLSINETLLRLQHDLNFNKKEIQLAEEILIKRYQLNITSKFARYFYE